MQLPISITPLQNTHTTINPISPHQPWKQSPMPHRWAHFPAWWLKVCRWKTRWWPDWSKKHAGMLEKKSHTFTVQNEGKPIPPQKKGESSLGTIISYFLFFFGNLINLQLATKKILKDLENMHLILLVIFQLLDTCEFSWLSSTFNSLAIQPSSQVAIPLVDWKPTPYMVTFICPVTGPNGGSTLVIA